MFCYLWVHNIQQNKYCFALIIYSHIEFLPMLQLKNNCIWNNIILLVKRTLLIKTKNVKKENLKEM